MEPGRTLSHYRLIEKIGEGGMGVVWKAQDTILGRQVAVKVLSVESSHDERRQKMFFEEARLASSLSDAHIAQVYEFGRDGDREFIAMEYVEGKPLSSILHGRPIPSEKVVALGLQVARALSRAHRKGLIHRDLKPSNLLVTPDGELKVVDFGLAILFEPPDATIGSQLETRSAIDGVEAGARAPSRAGTLPYMSPEQVRGETLDARTDIFSFGIVLYEMTTGQRPFAGVTSGELAQEIARARARPPHELVPRLPLELDRIVHKSLAARREDRYQTMDDLAVDLKRLERELESGSSPSYDAVAKAVSGATRRWLPWAALGAAVLTAAVGGAWWILRGEGGDDARSVVVWPLVVHGRPQGGEILGRAFAEQIAVDLAQASGLEVLPVPAGAKAEAEDALERARSLGAARLLVGTIETGAGTVTATIRLVDAPRNRLLWGTNREGTEAEIPSLAAGLARDVMARFGITPPTVYDVLQSTSVDNPTLAASPDWPLVLTSAVGDRAPSDEVSGALEHLRAEFPSDPLLLATRATILSNADYNMPTDANLGRLKASIADLEQVDPRSPYPAELTALELTARGRFAEAIALFDTLGSRSDLSPAFRAQLLTNRGHSHRLRGDLAAALSDFEAAMGLAPGDANVVSGYASILRDLRRTDEALESALRGQALAWNSVYSQEVLGMILADLGRWKDAVEAMSLACEMGRMQENCAMVAIFLVMSGRRADAEEAARGASLLPETYFGQYNLGCYYARAGLKSEALRCLRRSVELGYASAPALRQDEDLASLRGEREFAAIVAGAEKNARKP